ncbi:MAG: hypothetical protein QXP38_02430 [Nitrososphaerota archaeon]
MKSKLLNYISNLEVIVMDKSKEIIYGVLDKGNVCVHIMSYIKEKTETISIRSKPYPPTFPSHLSYPFHEWYVYPVKVKGRYLPYNLGLHNFYYYNDSYWPYGVAIGHPSNEPDSEELCKLIRETWQKAANVYDFFALLVDEQEMDRLFQGWHRLIGYINLNELSWGNRRLIKKWDLYNDPEYRVIGHWMYTKKRWDGSIKIGNSGLFHLKIMGGVGGDYLND